MGKPALGWASRIPPCRAKVFTTVSTEDEFVKWAYGLLERDALLHHSDKFLGTIGSHIYSVSMR